MHMSGEDFVPFLAAFSAGKSSVGSSEDGVSLLLVELPSQRARNKGCFCVSCLMVVRKLFDKVSCVGV